MWKAVLLMPNEWYYASDKHIGGHSNSIKQEAQRLAYEYTLAGIVPPEGYSTKAVDQLSLAWTMGYWFVRYYPEPEKNEFGVVSP